MSYIQVRDVLKKFQGDSPLTRDDVRVIERMDECIPFFSGQLMGVYRSFVKLFPLQNNRCAEFFCLSDFDKRGVRGHDNRRRDA